MLAPEKLRKPVPLPPIDSRFGGDDRMGGTSDRTDVKELVDYDIERRQYRKPTSADYEAEARHVRRPMPLPDPDALAMTYLQKAGFAPNDMFAAKPALDAAAANSALERQITGPLSGGTRAVNVAESTPPLPPSGSAPPSP